MADNDSERKTVLVAYILYTLSLIFPVASIAGVIVNHLKINEVEDKTLQSHHRWLMRTFWFALLWGVLGAMTFALFGLGYLIWVVAGIWFIYRLIRGWLNYSDNKAMYAEE